MQDSPAANTVPRRAAVIGTTGSGKTTFARTLARIIGAQHIELDALHWGPDWTPQPEEAFSAQVIRGAAAARWVSDGNYHARTRDVIWARADTIVWLDYSMPRILWQLLRRTIGRVVSREELWHGNRETVRKAFFSTESLFVWAFKSHWRHRREYTQRLQAPEYAHLRVLRVRTPAEALRFLESLSAAASRSGCAVESSPSITGAL